MGVFDDLGVPTIVNAAGPLTRLSGAPLHPEVINAMAEAAQHCVRMEDLEAAAGQYLADVTGAEAGYVTSGAAAGLALGAAACIAGLDPALMDLLPGTEGIPNQLVIQRPHLTSYSHALRTAGARLIEVGYLGYPGQGTVWPWQVEAAITSETVGLAYSVRTAPGVVPLETMVEIAHKHGLPVIVDAAAALPPVANLRGFIAAGADLVVFSGGKAIGGPQASGILVGKAPLVESVALQHQDMDILPATWKGRERYLQSQRFPGPPHHGIGRPMKVGKEGIVGLVTALRRFLATDHDEERRREEKQLMTILDGLQDLAGIRTEILSDHQAPRPYATALVRVDEQVIGRSVESLINELADGSPPIAVSHNFVHEHAIGIIASSLRQEEELLVLSKVREIMTAGS